MKEEIRKLIQDEKNRQANQLSLIASENYTSKAVRMIQSSYFTNKYAEGYPHKRYYAGCRVADEIESLAIQYAKDLYQVDHVNVQPHSGSQANQAAFLACLNIGDTILTLSLKDGGHLTHGTSINLSGKLYKTIHYNLNTHAEIDYEDLEQKALTYKPKLIIAGFTCFCYVIDWERIRSIADQSNSIFLADISHISGLVAGSAYPSPVPFADIVTSSTHKTIRGPRGGMIMCKQHLAKKIDKAVFPGLQGGPIMQTIAGKAQAFYEASLPSFKQYARQVVLNSQAMAETFLQNNISLVLDKPANHIIWIDLRNKNTNGTICQDLLESNNIIANKNAIPNDPLPPTVTSGIRLGTAAITTRGFKEKDAIYLAQIISALINKADRDYLPEIARICNKFPIPD